MTLPLIVLPDAPPELPQVLWERTVPSRIELKQELIDGVFTVMREHHLVSTDEEHWLALCLDEALVNAILHGNEADETVPVRIQVGLDADRWVIRIDDQGDGFSAVDVPDQDDSENLLLEHGRGIRLMREWLDRLCYYRGGSTIVMAKVRNPT
jgi:serine/threonine-protein kinase RsbW